MSASLSSPRLNGSDRPRLRHHARQIQARLPGAGRDRHADHADLRGRLAVVALQGVLLGDVGDLVADDGRELVLVFRDLEDSREHADMPAGEREGIDLLAVEHLDLPVLVGVRRRQLVHDGIGNAGDVSCAGRASVVTGVLLRIF